MRRSIVISAVLASSVLVGIAAPRLAWAAPTSERAPSRSALDELKAQHEALRRLQARKAGEAELQRQVDGLVDYAWFTDAALRRKGGLRQDCGTRCAEVGELLARLVRRTYLDLLGRSDRGDVEYLDEERRPRATKVRTRVRWQRDGHTETMEVAYVLHVVDGRWRVRDVITDGVSLVNNYRHDFNRVIERDGIEGLIARLEGKLGELARKD